MLSMLMIRLIKSGQSGVHLFRFRGRNAGDVMEPDEGEVEVLAARVKKAIHQSNELIRQGKVLAVQTAVFLNQLKLNASAQITR